VVYFTIFAGIHFGLNQQTCFGSGDYGMRYWKEVKSYLLPRQDMNNISL